MAGGINLFLYSENNPINFIDPYGLKPCGGSELSKCEALCKSRGAEVLVCEEQTSCNWWGEITATACTCTDHEKWGGFREGKPDVPDHSTKVQREVEKIKSKDFKDFLDKHNISKKDWHKVMEKYRTPSGDIVKRHWWEGPGGRSFYHK